MLGFSNPTSASRPQELPLLERAGDAAGPQPHASPARPPGSPPRTTTSLTAKRPPGLSTRNASASTLPLVAGEVDHAVGDDHVHRVDGQRDLLDLALEELDVRRRRPLPCSRAPGRASRRSCRGRRPCPSGPTRFADSRTSMPPPDPRSRTVSPSFSCASAVGFPQPSDASSASAGRPAVCPAS